ncbi:MAG TPA: PKD domain-containing protein, partial [Thermoanaerobaculia bacterium]
MRPSLGRSWLFVCLLVLVPFQRAWGTCNYPNVPTVVDQPATSDPQGQLCGPTVPGFNANLTGNDYALLYFDAKDPACAAGASQVLQDKLTSNLNFAERGGVICSGLARGTVNPFQSWLAGAPIAAMYMAAVKLMEAGHPVNDDLLRRAGDQIRSLGSPQDLGCGTGPYAGANSCMDDYAVTAAGFAWVAAYETEAGRDGSWWAARARDQMRRALSPIDQTGGVCFYRKGTNPARCDADFPELDAGLARVIGANHGQETPSYGFGLMTSIATACDAFRKAGIPGYSCTDFSANELRIARELMTEAQQKTYFSGGQWIFKTDACFQIVDGAPKNCGELSDPNNPSSPPVYSPLDYPLKRFYDFLGIGTLPGVVTDTVRRIAQGQLYAPDPGPSHQFDVLDPNRYTFGRTDFIGPLRRLFYYEEGYNAWPAPTPESYVYWIQPAELAGFGAPGTLTVAGGAITLDGTTVPAPVQMQWRDATTSSAWSQVGDASPVGNGAPTNVWYNSVPGPIDPAHHYEVQVRQGNQPWSASCAYNGGNKLWWCQGPVARFTGSCDGLSCSFDDQKSQPFGSIASWSWSFGDGHTGSGPDVSNTYPAGLFSAYLTVQDSAGNSATAGLPVYAGVTPLTPDIVSSCGGQATQICSASTYTFDAG